MTNAWEVTNDDILSVVAEIPDFQGFSESEKKDILNQLNTFLDFELVENVVLSYNTFEEQFEAMNKEIKSQIVSLIEKDELYF